jgi:inorganic pyrophosphatase
MRISVFIQNEAGSNQKHYHDEKTLEWKRMARVSRPYPFPYGFVIGTTSADACNVDCFVITQHSLKTGQIVECDTIGLMEQIEDGQEDHNVLAQLHGESGVVDASVQAKLTDFVLHVFDHVDGKQIHVGRFLDADDAGAFVAARSD